MIKARRIRLFRRDFLQVDPVQCPCNRSVRSFGLTGRLMTFTQPGMDRTKRKKLRLLSEKSGWKVNATRLFELQRKTSGNNGTSVKVVLFFRMECSKHKFEYHSLIKPIFDTSSRLSLPNFGNRNWFVKVVDTIPKRNLPVLDFGYLSPKQWADWFSHVTECDVFHKQKVLNKRRSDKSENIRDLTKLRRRQQQELQNMSKITTLHQHHAFLYISLPSLCN